MFSLDCFSPGVRAPCLCAGVECLLGRSASSFIHSFGAWCTVETCVQSKYFPLNTWRKEKGCCSVGELLDVCVWVVCECFNFNFVAKKVSTRLEPPGEYGRTGDESRGELVASAFPHPIAAPHSRNLHTQESSSGSVKARVTNACLASLSINQPPVKSKDVVVGLEFSTVLWPLPPSGGNARKSPPVTTMASSPVRPSPTPGHVFTHLRGQGARSSPHTSKSST